MKKILLLIPVFLVTLIGCTEETNEVTSMEEAYALFTTNKANGYIVTHNYNDTLSIFDITNSYDFTITFPKSDGDTYVVCKDVAGSSVRTADGEVNGTQEVYDMCQKTFSELQESITANVENEMFYNSNYDTKYETTDNGFIASGTYSDKTDYELKINTEASKVEFVDGDMEITMELK